MTSRKKKEVEPVTFEELIDKLINKCMNEQVKYIIEDVSVNVCDELANNAQFQRYIKAKVGKAFKG